MKKDLSLTLESRSENILPGRTNTYCFRQNSPKSSKPNSTRYRVKSCSICGNIYQNRTFRGGYICEDCVVYVREM